MRFRPGLVALPLAVPWLPLRGGAQARLSIDTTRVLRAVHRDVCGVNLEYPSVNVAAVRTVAAQFTALRFPGDAARPSPRCSTGCAEAPPSRVSDRAYSPWAMQGGACQAVDARWVRLEVLAHELWREHFGDPLLAVESADVPTYGSDGPMSWDGFAGTAQFLKGYASLAVGRRSRSRGNRRCA